MKNFDRNVGIIGAIILAFILFCVYGCNTPKYLAKRADKHFNKSYKEDSALVKGKLAELFPPKPAVIKQGKTITIVNKDSLKKLNKVIDSLRNVPAKIVYSKDSNCNKLINQNYTEGYTTGYLLGKWEAKRECPPPTSQTDTVFQDSPETLLLLSTQKDELLKAKIQADRDAATIAKLEKKVSNRTIWALSFLVAFMAAIIWIVFSFKIKK